MSLTTTGSGLCAAYPYPLLGVVDQVQFTW